MVLLSFPGLLRWLKSAGIGNTPAQLWLEEAPVLASSVGLQKGDEACSACRGQRLDEEWSGQEPGNLWDTVITVHSCGGR